MMMVCPRISSWEAFADPYGQEILKQWNVKLHDPNSPFLIGGFRAGDKIVEVRQESYIDKLMTLF